MNGRHGHRGAHIPQQGFAELLKLLCREQAGMESETFQPRQPHGLAVVLQGLFNDREKTTMPTTTAVWTPHVWHNPENTQAMAMVITQELTQVAPNEAKHQPLHRVGG